MWGSSKGWTDDKGNHYDRNGNYNGWTDNNGNHYDRNGNYNGWTDHNGNNYDRNGNNTDSSGCFLTTACVEYKGLTDDCRELNTLRNFRDTYMDKNYADNIKEYYAIAPKIVEHINSLTASEKEEVYNDIYNTVIECCKLIDNNELESTYLKYKDMVNSLAAKYLK